MINSIENTSKLDRFIRTDGLIVDALLACIFHLFAVVVAFFVDNFTRDAYIPYPVLMTGAIVAITLLVVRRLRAVALVKVLLHVGVVIAYPVLVQLCTGLLTPVSNLVAMIFMLATHVGYSFFDSFKPRKGLVKPYLLATTVVVNVIVHFILTAGAYEEYSVDASGLLINVFIGFLLYFIARQICVFEESYRHSLMSSSGPVEQIKKQNNKIK